MLRKTLAISAFSALLVCLFFVGCAETTDLSLKLAPQSVQTYKYSMETYKQVKFERPSEKNVSDKVTKSSLEMIYDQAVEKIEDDGSVIADITIKEMKYSSENPKSSETSMDTSGTLAGLAGKIYKIKIQPNGKAMLVDAADVTSAVKKGREARIIETLFNGDSIAKRHSIAALSDVNNLPDAKPGAKWTVEEPSPKGMMQSKNYEKIYELKDIKKNEAGEKIAVIELSTIPGEGVSGPGMFAMFGDKIDSDFSDSYTGTLEYNLNTGKIIKYGEALKADWVAVDKSKQKADEMPDTLTIGFGSKFNLEAVN